MSSPNIWTPGVVWAHQRGEKLRRLVDWHEITCEVEFDELRSGQWHRGTMQAKQWQALCFAGRVVGAMEVEA